MSRNKSNTKTAWKRKDKEYRLAQNARARKNREGRALEAQRQAALAAGLPWPPVEDEVTADEVEV